MKSTLIVLLCLSVHVLSSQCNEDRHNTTSVSNWISCEKTASLNPARGDSYWINYDFGELKTVKDFHFWNINNPDHLDAGARQIAIDYSTDGVNWDFWGIWEAQQGTTSGFYQGESGPSLDDLVAQHLLLTIIDNYGGDCNGFGEIRIGVEDYMTSTSDAHDLAQVLQAYPNPATDYTFLKMKSTYAGPATAELIDVTGRRLQSQAISLTKGYQELKYDLDVPVSGQYIIRIVTPLSETSTELSITKTK